MVTIGSVTRLVVLPLFIIGLGLFVSPLPARPDAGLWSADSTELVSDTEDLIARNGLPDFRIPVTPSSEDEFLLLYDNGDTLGGPIDFAYLVDEEEGIQKKLVPLKRPQTSNNRTHWLDSTADQLRQTVQSLKETKSTLDKNIHALPRFNYFDRVELFSDEMEFELGRSKHETRTVLVLEPGQEAVSLTFHIPFTSK